MDAMISSLMERLGARKLEAAQPIDFFGLSKRLTLRLPGFRELAAKKAKLDVTLSRLEQKLYLLSSKWYRDRYKLPITIKWRAPRNSEERRQLSGKLLLEERDAKAARLKLNEIPPALALLDKILARKRVPSIADLHLLPILDQLRMGEKPVILAVVLSGETDAARKPEARQFAYDGRSAWELARSLAMEAARQRQKTAPSIILVAWNPYSEKDTGFCK